LTCSDKIVNSGDFDAVEFSMPLKFSGDQQALAEVVANFRVTIIADEDTIIANLEYSNGNITSLIENVPAGPNRTIIVEGLAADGTVLYRGTVVIEVIAGQTVDAVVTLLPVAKLVRVSPHYVNKYFGESFTSDIKVNNITGLSGIELALDFNSTVIELDSVRAGIDLPEGAVFSYSDEGGIEISLSHSSPMVDSSGDATIARIFFSPTSAIKCLDSTIFDLGVVTLTAPGVTLGDIYIDDGQAKINRGRLMVSPDTLQFGHGVEGLNLDFKQVDITDSCGNEIPFTLSTEYDWIDLNTVVAGITPGSVFIDVDTTGFESGTYEGRVKVSSAKATNAPFDIVVILILDRGFRSLQVSPENLYFTAQAYGPPGESQEFIVFEAGGYSIPYVMIQDISWYAISRTSGSTEDTVSISVRTTELSPGLYRDSIRISSEEADNSPIYLQITLELTVNPASVRIEPDTISYIYIRDKDQVIGNGQFEVSASGFNTPFSLLENVPWLNLSDNNVVTPYTIATNLNLANIPEPGQYFDSIKITFDFLPNSPFYVFVALEVQENQFLLQVIPDNLYFEYLQSGDDNPTGQFRVFEADGYHIPFEVVENIPWLSLSDDNGITEDTLTVYIDPSIDSGLYIDSIMIFSEDAKNSPQKLTVLFDLRIGPRVLATEPTSLHFNMQQSGDLPDPKTFLVFETGGHIVNYFASTEASWFSISGVSGATPDTVTVRITSLDLVPGMYRDSIEIMSEEADNLPIYVVVSLGVSVGPRTIEVEPDTIHLEYIQYSDAFPTATFRVFESEGYNIPFSAVENIPWLFLSDTSGITEDTITAYFAGAGLDSGLYVDSIMVSSESAENSPVYVKVTLEIVYVPRPSLVPIPQTLYFSAQENGALPSPKRFEVFSSLYPTFFTATESIPWLNLTDFGGTTGNTVTVHITSTILDPGVYFDSIFVSTEDQNFINAYVYIQYTVFPSISGVVRDGSGQALADVLVIAYDDYPNGNFLDSAFTDSYGSFRFSDITGNIDLYAFKDGYYPQIVSVETPDINVLISLLATPAFTPTDQWVDLFCDSSYVHGNLIQPNDVIEAFDPDGVLCGRFVVHTEGAFGFMHVYRDDQGSTTIDEGCETSDIITLKVNSEIAVTDQPLIYPSSHSLIEACFNVTGEIPKWIVVLRPEGGETFYQDSSISIEWSSTGIFGPVEISLSRTDKVQFVHDTTDNDGQHGITIPIGITNANDWYVSVRDLDEPASDYSENFTISSVELLLGRTSLSFHGVESDCVLGQKQFTISEKSGFNIPFEIINTVSWLSVSPANGTTPAVVTVNILANELSTGTYESILTITSNSAVNSPTSITVGLEIGQYLCGDFNNDCQLRVGDLTNMIDYLYRDGPAPLFPDALNVDLCDGVDIADVDYLYTRLINENLSICESVEKCMSPDNDLGAQDSLAFAVSQAPSVSDETPRLQLDLYLFNDGNVFNGLASGFGWDNSNMQLDSMRFSPYVEDSISINIALESDVIDSTNAHNRFLFVANKTIFSGIPPAPSQQLLASYYFTLSSWTSADSIVVDTLTFSQGTAYKAATNHGSYQPAWHGPVIVKEQGF